MKKLLSIAAAFGITALSSSTVISCNNTSYSWDGDLSRITDIKWGVQIINIDKAKANLNELPQILFDRIIAFSGVKKDFATKDEVNVTIMLQANDLKTTLTDEILSFSIEHNLDTTFYFKISVNDNSKHLKKTTTTGSLQIKIALNE